MPSLSRILIISFGYYLQDDLDLENESDTSISSTSSKQVEVGICAMGKKSESKPMKEIIARLQEFEYIKMVVFNEDVILKVNHLWNESDEWDLNSVVFLGAG